MRYALSIRRPQQHHQTFDGNSSQSSFVLNPVRQRRNNIHHGASQCFHHSPSPLGHDLNSPSPRNAIPSSVIPRTPMPRTGVRSHQHTQRHRMFLLSQNVNILASPIPGNPIEYATPSPNRDVHLNETSPLVRNSLNRNGFMQQPQLLPPSLSGGGGGIGGRTSSASTHFSRLPVHDHPFKSATPKKKFLGVDDLTFVRNIREKLYTLNLLEESFSINHSGTEQINALSIESASAASSSSSRHSRGSVSLTGMGSSPSYTSVTNDRRTKTKKDDDVDDEASYFWLLIVFSGQALSFFLACGGAAQAALAMNCNVSAPTFTVGIVYVCLSFCLIPLYYERKKTGRTPLPFDDTVENRQKNSSHDNNFDQNSSKAVESIVNAHSHNSELHERENAIERALSTYHYDENDEAIPRNPLQSSYGNLFYITPSSYHTREGDSTTSRGGRLGEMNPSLHSRNLSNRSISSTPPTTNHSVSTEGSIDLFELSQHSAANNVVAENSRRSSEQFDTNDDFVSYGYEYNKEYPFLFGILNLSAPAYVYFGMALLDVYANYFTVLAYKYTTITSVTLLDALAIPSSMILSKIFLHRKYTTMHLFGVCLCMIGVTLNISRDYKDDATVQSTVPKPFLSNATLWDGDNLNNESSSSENTEKMSQKFYGDLLAFTGGVLFGAGNVLGEVAVRNYGGPNEYIGMLGFFAAIICGIQSYIFEYQNVVDFFTAKRDDATNQCSSGEQQSLVVAFVFVTVLGYLGGARFLQYSEAAFLNLSLLTGDMWSVLFSVFTLNIVPKPLFYVALLFTMSGVVAYEIAPSPMRGDCEDDLGDYDVDGVSMTYGEGSHEQRPTQDISDSFDDRSDNIRYTETNHNEEIDDEEFHEEMTNVEHNHYESYGDYTHASSYTGRFDDPSVTATNNEESLHQNDDEFDYTDTEQSLNDNERNPIERSLSQRKFDIV